MKNVYKLRGVVQPYSWGGTDFIPQLLTLDNPDQKPFAEYWLGAHPAAPAQLEGENRSLLQLVGENPGATLGETTAHKFGSLPYLFKILDVRNMLSIQVHPSKAAAEEEYEKENKKDVPLAAPHRNYKDKNHKPELMLALGDFWLLHGFKPVAQLTSILERVEALRFLLPVFRERGYKGLYEDVMTLPQEKVNDALRPLLQTIIPQYREGRLQKSEEHFWAARAALTFCKDDNVDRGIFSVYLFNLLHLRKGEAIYQAAGLPHAYLEGHNVEVMANSDNVLRAGLTDKHIDVPELMKHVKFEPTDPAIVRANDNGVQAFETPAEEFLLTQFNTANDVVLRPHSGTVLFVYEGGATALSESGAIAAGRGEALFLLPGNEVIVRPSGAPVVFYTVSAATEKK